MTACAFTAVRNHSDDRVQVRTGRAEALILCGYHASEFWLSHVVNWCAKPHKTTADLKPGDRIVLPEQTRTVKEVVPTQYRNEHNEIIYAVMWQEGGDEVWGAGNSGLSDSTWEVAQ